MANKIMTFLKNLPYASKKYPFSFINRKELVVYQKTKIPIIMSSFNFLIDWDYVCMSPLK